MARNERSAGFILFRRGPAASASADASAASPVEFLLLDYGRHWEFAKGHVHAGESDLDAARRELTEETGIDDARVIPGFREEPVYFFRDRKKGLVRKTVVFFLAETKAADVVLSHEHVGFAFLPLDQALKRVTFAGARQVLRAAHDHLVTVGEVTACPPGPSELFPDPGPPTRSSAPPTP